MEPWLKWVLIVVGAIVLVVCCCGSLAAAGGLFAFNLYDTTGLRPEVRETVEMTTDPISPDANDTLEVLVNSEVPENDLVELAERLLGQQDIPQVMESPALEYQVGDTETFWASEMDTTENFEVVADLEYITPHAYFWVEQGVNFDADALAQLAETFEDAIYPQTRAVFGSEWSPGIDHDEHLYLLYARGLGSGIAGYFSSRDSVHPSAYEYSNTHEMFLFNVDTVDLEDDFTYGVLAHEFQHMIQWNVDRNESTWMNEGLSELAAFLMGYSPGGFDWMFMVNPDRQLTYWPNDSDATASSYGSAFLFSNYFYNRFGEELTKELVSHDENGLESVDLVLQEAGLQETADDLVLDWVIANYLGDDSVADGRYAYSNYPNAPKAGDTETLSSCDDSVQERTVRQYAADYIAITCPGSYQLVVEGSTEVGVIPVDAHGGEWMWWSNRGDESDMTLTRQFDLRSVEGQALLKYWTWYDLEADYDYLYVEGSLDGETWEILDTPRGTDLDPSGNSYGWAYNGQTGAWVQEQVDLSSYAGQQVWVRFEYITDAAVNGEGFALDDVTLDVAGYTADFEDNDGGWEADGFVRISNRLPQEYGLSLIRMGNNGTQVQRLEMDASNHWDGLVEIGSDVEKVVLVISGLTRYTNEPAGYRFNLVRQ